MSRSIHTTHKDVRHYPRSWFGGEPDEYVRDLRHKREVKEQVRRERRGPEPTSVPRTKPDALPIVIADEGPNVLYPADAADIRAILSFLPPHSIDGLEGVTLELGIEDQANPCGRADCSAMADPFLGRHGFERRPGLYAPHYHGCYARNRVHLYAFVIDPQASPSRTELVGLVDEMLSTLVHEVAHHVDETQRVARGRWLSSDAEKAEDFAWAKASEWSAEIVAPYVESKFGIRMPRD